MPDDLPAIDQAETFLDCLLIGLYVGFDTRSAQAIERGLKLFIAAPVRVAVGRDQQIISFQVQRLVQLGAGIQFGDQLADAVDQNVLVMNGRQAENTRRDRDLDAVMFVFAGRFESGLVEREKIGCSIEPISSFGIASVTSQMKKSWIGWRSGRSGERAGLVFLGHSRIVLSPMGSVTFVLSHMNVKIRVFTHGLGGFVLSHMKNRFVYLPMRIRAFTHSGSCICP